MTYLICNVCFQIPFIEFMPGLLVKFTCCTTNIIRHFDLDMHITRLTSLKCSRVQCHSKSSNFHYFLKSILCEDCFKNYLANNNIKQNNYIEYDYDKFPKICKEHFKPYKYYDEKKHLLFCDDCDSFGNEKEIKEIQKNCKRNLLTDYNENKGSYSKYFEKLIKIIIETYKKYEKSMILNAYYNLSNLNNFLKNYSIILPLCPKCNKIFKFNIKNDNYISKKSKSTIEFKNKTKSFEVSCNCIKNEQYNSIIEFEKSINSIICYNCHLQFDQKYILYDCISEKYFCEECSKTFISLDYIRFNEMKIICWIHKIKFESYCKNCNKLFCPKCKNINRHVLINLTNQSESAELFIKSFGRLNWLLSLKDNGLFNFENEKRTCINKLDRKDLIKKEKAYIIKKIEEKEGKFDASLFKIYSTLNSVKIKNCLYKFEIFETKVDYRVQIIEMKNKLINSELILTTLFKEIGDKSEIINLLRIRNTIQHLIIEIIKRNYSCFAKIEGDFRILYESYNYLNYKLNVNKINVHKELEELFTNFENLIKTTIQKKAINKFLIRLQEKNKEESLNIKLDNERIKEFKNTKNIKLVFENTMKQTTPKISLNHQLMLFNDTYENEVKKMIDDEKFSVLKQYNDFLSNQNLFQTKEKSKFKNITNLIGELEKNNIPEEIEKLGFYKKVKIVSNEYTDKYGFICDKNVNSSLIKELLKNSQKDEGYQYLIIEKEYEDEFIKSLDMENYMEFYFVYSLMNNIIKRIGSIVHQNDNDFNIIFNNVSINLENIMKYKLIKDNEEKDSFKYIDSNHKEIIEIILKNNIKLNDLREFANTFISKSVGELKKLLGNEKINEMTKKCHNSLNDFMSADRVQKQINNILKLLKKNISFLNDYKILFTLFPEIKNYIVTVISENYLDKDSDFETECINIIKEDINFNSFVNYYINNYLVTNSLYKEVEKINNKFEKDYKEYLNVLEKDLFYEYAIIILRAYKKKIFEYKIEDIFKQEKVKLIEIFIKSKENKLKEIESKKNINNTKYVHLMEKMTQEVKKIESVVQRMKDINIADYINKKFKNYLDNIDIHSFAFSKFDVILYLYQNNYI